jgi:outer membrane protein TolC
MNNLLNNKTTKSLLALLLAGAMLVNSQIGIAKAAETNNISGTQEETITTKETLEDLSLPKALEIAIANNLDLKTAEAEMNRNLLSASQQSKIAKSDDDTAYYDSDLAIEIAKLNKDLLPKIAKESYEAAKMSVELEVKNAYAQLLYAKENYELAAQYKAQTDESYAFIQKKFALGQVSNIEVLNAQAEVATKEAELVQAVINYKQKNMDMNLLLNKPLDKEWLLDKTINSSIISLPAYDTLRSHMLENHPSVLGANLSFKTAEATFDLAKGFYTPNMWKYQFAEHDYNKAQFVYQQELLKIEKNLHQAYVNVDGSLKAIEMYEKSVDSIKESYRVSKIRYELGMITSHDLNEALLAQQRMESTLQNAKLNYQIAIAQLEFLSAYEIN